MNPRILEDDTLQIDPREHVIEHYGHGRYYTTHECPHCENLFECVGVICKLACKVECLPCLTRELLSDTERFSKEAREFINATVPTDAQGQGLMWWKDLRSEIDGKLKGLSERSRELQKRIDSEVKQ